MHSQQPSSSSVSQAAPSSFTTLVISLFAVIILQFITFVTMFEASKSVLFEAQSDQFGGSVGDNVVGSGGSQSGDAGSVKPGGSDGPDVPLSGLFHFASSHHRSAMATESCYVIEPKHHTSSSEEEVAPVSGESVHSSNDNNNNGKHRRNHRDKRNNNKQEKEEEAEQISPAPESLTNLRDAAIVVLAYDRPHYLSRTVHSIQRAKFAGEFAARFISIDGDDRNTLSMARKFSAAHASSQRARGGENNAPDARATSFETLHHRRAVPPPGMSNTYSLAAHYRFVFDEMFVKRNFSHLIVFEDDMDVGPDIFSFFDTFTPVLDSDPTVWCISSWNDNAFDPPFHLDPTRVFRSSYFPGLGWMLKRSLWVDDLSKKWPNDNWDHWMRVSSTHKQRSCIVPFVSRNFNFGSEEASTGSNDFYTRYLARAKTTGSKEDLQFSSAQLQHHQSSSSVSVSFVEGHISSEAAYDEWIQNEISKAIVINDINQIDLSGSVDSPLNVGNVGLPMRKKSRFAQQGGGDVENVNKPIVYPYVSEQYESVVAARFNVHPFPRTHYKYTSWFTLKNGRNLFLVDRRLSPFASDAIRIAPKDSLEPVAARAPGISCDAACGEFGRIEKKGQLYACDASQFDFINSCEVLAEAFSNCACQQGWGEDIPNMEAASIHHPPPANCLVTEMKPTCAASHPMTTRLCPCVRV